MQMFSLDTKGKKCEILKFIEAGLQGDGGAIGAHAPHACIFDL